ncbi:hypothetical protein, partial [Chitinophaga sp.]|uniref:immunoglobulin domain-containing protein n=1 Tax=Chitinophaga sp. TaxID=1869181 RepID=UPI002F95AFB3
MHLKIYPVKSIIVSLILFFLFSVQQASAQIYANSQTNAVTGLCLLCGVSNPNNAVNTNLTDYSTFNITAGLLGVSVSQTLIFPSGTAGCDSLIIGIGSGNSALSVNLVAGLTVQTFNGATANSDLTNIDSTNLRLLGGARGEVFLKPAASFDRVKITLSSSLLGLLNAFHLYYAWHQATITAPTAIDSTSICYGDSASLTATTIPGATIQWFSTATGGTALYTGSPYKVAPLTTTTYYAQASIGGCTSSRKAITVIIKARPDNPVFHAPANFSCGATAVTIDNYIVGTDYNVRLTYEAKDGDLLDSSFVITGNGSFTLPPFIYPQNVSANLYIQAVDSITGCTSDTIRAIYILGSTPTLPPTTSFDSITVCQGTSVTLHATPAGSGTAEIRWYDAPTGGTLLYTSNSYPVSPAVTTTYYVAAAATCENPQRVPVKVIVGSAPVPEFTVPTAPVCGSAAITITNHVPGNNYTVRLIYSSPAAGLVLDTLFTVINSNIINTFPINVASQLEVNFYIRSVSPLTGCISDIAGDDFSQSAAADCPSNEFRMSSIQQPPKTATPKTATLAIFPNPTNGIINLGKSKDYTGNLIIIRDASGREVQREVLKQ